MAGLYSFIIGLSDGLESECFDKVFARHRLHKNSSAVISGLCLKCAYTKLTAIMIAFVFNFKSFHFIVVKKIFKNKNGLCLAVIIAFIRQSDLNILIQILTYFAGLTVFQSIDHIIQV